MKKSLLIFSEEFPMPKLNPWQQRVMNQIIENQRLSSNMIIFMPRKMGYNTFKKHFDMEQKKKR